MKLNIALLAGGNSSEREVSLRSAMLMEKAFDPEKYNVWLIAVHGREWIHTDGDNVSHNLNLNDFSLSISGVRIMMDLVFNVIHGSPGENGEIQGYLDFMDIPYAGCGLASSVVTFNKTLTKRMVEGIEGLHLARQMVVRKGEIFSPDAIVSELGLPLFVKPDASGSSFGVTKVKEVHEIEAAIASALKESDTVLIEEFIAGREFGCGLIMTSKRNYVLPVTEIIPKKEFFDYEAKYTDGMCDEIVPADISPALSQILQSVALDAAKACGCMGIVRIDFIVDENGDAYMMEINSIPGMSPESIVPKAVRAAGMTMGEVVDIIVDDCRCTRQ